MDSKIRVLGLQLAGNGSLYRSLLLDLAGRHKRTWEALQGALGQADTEQFVCLAHGLKGTAANLGVLNVASQAAELETLACAGLPVTECLTRLQNTLIQLRGGLKYLPTYQKLDIVYILT